MSEPRLFQDILFTAVYPPLKGGNGLILLLILTTPSKFIMRPPWGSERSASFFTSLKQKKVRRGGMRRIRRLADLLDAFAAIKSPEMRRRQNLVLHPLRRTWLWDDNMGLFGLKIG